MKAVILAAGQGRRMEHLSRDNHKSLLPLAGTTILGHSLNLLQSNGIDEIVLVTGYQRFSVVEHSKSIWNRSIRPVFNPLFSSTNVLFSFWLATPWLLGSDVLFLHADTVFCEEVLTRLQNASGEIVFTVDRHECEEEEMKVRISDGLVTEVNKEMHPEEADGEFLGLALLRKNVLPRLQLKAENLLESGHVNSFFEQAVQRCIDEEGVRVHACDVTGLPWREIDFEEDYLGAIELFGS